MGNRFVDGLLFYRMIASGAANLKERAETVNALNVFPVPDGDTGSNMSRTIDAGLAALAEQKPAQIGEAAKHLSSGLLMGARGNSGVILSQLFRGFAQALDGLTRAGTVQFAEAMQKGVETAYKAVIKPVEGTILTVAKDAAEAGVSAADRFDNLETWLEHVCDAMERSLKRTPDLLPILKKVGVVDSGGQGLLFIYEGMLAALKGDGQAPIAPSVPSHMNEKTDTRLLSEALSQDASSQTTGAQAKIRPEEIDFIYDMEFFIRLTAKCDGEAAAETLRNKLADVGDSVLVIHDDERIKVHVHANEPGNILNEALRHGELTDIHIQNMRDQHREAARVDAGSSKRIGLVAVAAGEGLADIFTSLGADVVLSGGQSMNPSTADIVRAVEETGAECVFVLPNNPNIMLTAEQAALVSERKTIVIPTKTIPQGMSAALAFDADGELDETERAMREAFEHVKSGSITYAVRDSEVGSLTIHKDDYLGLSDNDVIVADADLLKTCEALLTEIVDEDDEIITVIVGEQVEKGNADKVARMINERFPELELDWQHGGQPLYPFIFSIE